MLKPTAANRQIKDRPMTEERAIEILESWSNTSEKFANVVRTLYSKFLTVGNIDFAEVIDQAWEAAKKLPYDYNDYRDLMEAVYILVGEQLGASSSTNMPYEYTQPLSYLIDWINQIKDLDDYYDYADNKEEFLDELPESHLVISLGIAADQIEKIPETVDTIISDYEESKDKPTKTELLPISEVLLKKIEDAIPTIEYWVDGLAYEYERAGRRASTVDRVFDNPELVRSYLSVIKDVFFEEAPMNSEPEEAPDIMNALSDTISAIRQDDVLATYEALGEALSLMKIVIEEYP